MRVAIQTISWGVDPENTERVEQILHEAKEAGYEGVEIAIHPEKLGQPEWLYDTLREIGLELVGIARGSLDEKVTFIRDFLRVQEGRLLGFPAHGHGNIPAAMQPYIYVDERSDVEQAGRFQNEAILALHPHMFKSVQTAQEAGELLKAQPELRLIPDTAHLTIAGDNILEVIDTYFDRIASVHLKAWTAEYGRAYQFYARGFVNLGEGDVDLFGVLTLLKNRNYQGWLVVEKDASGDALATAKTARKWLKGQGI